MINSECTQSDDTGPPPCRLTPRSILTSTGASVRALICGDVEGHLTTLASNLSAVDQRQGPFGFALCCGNFLGDLCTFIPTLSDFQNDKVPAPDAEQVSTPSQSASPVTDYDFLSGRSNFPLPVFFIDSSISSTGEMLRQRCPDGLQMSPSLEFLGVFGFRKICGLTVGFLSGRYDPSVFFDEAEDEESIELPEQIDGSLGLADKGILGSTLPYGGSGVQSLGSGAPSVEIDNTDSTASSPIRSVDNSTLEVVTAQSTPDNRTSTRDIGTTPDPQTLRSLSVRDKQYVGGLHSGYYCNSMLQRFKNLGAPYVGRTDIFLTCEWPTGTDELLTSEQKQQIMSLLELGHETMRDSKSDRDSVTSPPISELVEMFEPRFHLAAGCGVFFQRPIYRTSEKGLASRFIGLGRLVSGPKVANDKRLKFLHALILKPMDELGEHALLAVPSSSTQSPYFSLYNPRSTPAAHTSHVQSVVSAESVRSPGLPQDTFGSPQDTFGSPNRFKRARPVSTNDFDNASFLETASLPPSFPPSSPERQPSDDNSKRQRISEPLVRPPPGSSTSPLAVLQSILASRGSPAGSQKAGAACEGPGSIYDGPGVKQEEDVAPSNSVFITNIPYQVDCESFMDVMKSFGSIAQYNFPRSPDGKSMGRAWVTYEAFTSAEQAVAASDQLESGGRLLKIQFTQSQFPGRRRFGDSDSGRFNGRTIQRQSSQAIDVRPHSDCWFCLANPNCEKRLIVSIGEKVYVALAKGGMVHQHVLIIPVTHFPNFVFCPPDVGLELERYIEALRRCYRSQGMGAIVYERYFPMKTTTGMHMQLQVVPIPNKCATHSLDVFQSRAERAGASLLPIPSDETMSSLRRRISDPVNQAYFYVELPGPIPDQVERCLHVTRPGDVQKSLPFNFGREAIATLMNVPNRSDWKRCVEPEPVETQLAQQMQKLFASFQPK